MSGSTATDVFAFTCGCTTETVLPATNEHHVLVCPLHPTATVAPFERSPLWEGKLTIEIMLKAETQNAASGFADAFEGMILSSPIVHGVTMSLEGSTE